MDCSLEKGEVLRLGGGPGLRLHCTQGALWITIGDGRDYVIHAGSCFELEKGCTALTEALASAKLCVVNTEHVADNAAISLRTCRLASQRGSLAASA
ncbi:DUF2917 domain-containing protein [Geomonas ferrireducens]|uniref:DUF2917 domain-containing protein n=1 Tax=Geomonas ferrireducens TaxID=2570227 RepID=UPI0010A92CCA|nr:DUF2917 domain-containing protein [Geomonas ferrireducens]